MGYGDQLRSLPSPRPGSENRDLPVIDLYLGDKASNQNWIRELISCLPNEHQDYVAACRVEDLLRSLT